MRGAGSVRMRRPQPHYGSGPGEVDGPLHQPLVAVTAAAAPSRTSREPGSMNPCRVSAKPACGMDGCSADRPGTGQPSHGTAGRRPCRLPAAFPAHRAGGRHRRATVGPCASTCSAQLSSRSCKITPVAAWRSRHCRSRAVRCGVAPVADRPIMHFTPVDNLRGVLQRGCLVADSVVQSLSIGIRECGDVSIKQRRRSMPVSVSPYGYVGDYVPFYFAPRSGSSLF